MRTQLGQQVVQPPLEAVVDSSGQVWVDLRAPNAVGLLGRYPIHEDVQDGALDLKVLVDLHEQIHPERLVPPIALLGDLGARGLDERPENPRFPIVDDDMSAQVEGMNKLAP